MSAMSPPPPPIAPLSHAPEGAAFHHFGPSHLAVLCTCAALLTLMVVVKHTELRRTARFLELVLGSALLLIWPVTTLVHWHLGSLDLNKSLPLQLCDIAGISGGVALWTHRQTACEIVYFMGLAGTLQGLITPNLLFDFPDLRFFAFFLLHGGVVVAALYVVTAMHHKPRPGAVPRQMATILSYAAFVGVINAALGTNYAFLCQKPAQASLMDQLGHWPWYIGGLILLALTFFTLLNLPFVILRRLRRPSA